MSWRYEIREYDGLMAGLRERADFLNVTRAQLDEAMKTLPDGYASKLLCPVPIRALGRISLGPMLHALGLKIVLVEDPTALRQVERRIAKRRKQSDDARHNMLATTKRSKWRFPKGREFAKLMQARQVLKTPAHKRSRIARKAANTRWRKVRSAAKLSAKPSPTPPPVLCAN
jgi:hypothetical protein